MRHWQPLAPVASAIGALALLIAGILLVPAPSSPDAALAARAVIGAFFVFCFWAISLICWGRILLKLAKLPGCGMGSRLALGTAGAAYVATLLGHAGLIGAAHATLLILALFAGPLLNARLPSLDRPALATKSAWLARMVLAIAGLAVVVCVARASFPQFHSDPLFYHLLGPRLWADAGRIYFPKRIPITLLCSYWDNLALWGQSLLSNRADNGLVEGQLFAQWTHAALGFGGAALLLRELFSAYCEDPLWRSVAVLAALSSGFLSETTWLAESDWGLVLWTLAGWRFLTIREEPPRAALFCAGACFGMAAGKPVSWLAVLPMLLFFAAGAGAKNRRVEKLSWIGAGLACALAPILARNFFYTGNPFFPVVTGFFSNDWLSSSLRTVYAPAQHSGLHERFLALAHRLALWPKRDPLAVVLPIALGALVLLRARTLRRRDYWLPAAGALILLVFIDASAAQEDGTMRIRWLGAILCLLLGFGVIACFDLLTRLGLSERPKTGVALALAGVACLGLPLPLHAVVGMLHAPNAALALRNAAMGGDSKAWLRLNAKSGEPVVSTGDDQLYYLSQFKVASVLEQPLLDEQTRSIGDPALLVCKLRATGARYALDTSYFDGRYWSKQAFVLSQLVRKHAESIVYQGRQSRVIDLAVLARTAAQPCAPNPAIAGLFDQ